MTSPTPLTLAPDDILILRGWSGLAEAAAKPLYCLGTAADCHPLHPLMLGYDRALVPWVSP